MQIKREFVFLVHLNLDDGNSGGFEHALNMSELYFCFFGIK